MVALAITSIVMLGSFQLFQEGMQLFRVNQAAADSQASVTKATGFLSTELANASPGLTRYYPNPSSGTGMPRGIVFATPLDANGNVRYDQANGQLYWQRLIAYYFVEDPTGGYNGNLYRAEFDIPPESSDGPGNRDINVVGNMLDSNTTSAFAGSGTRKRSVANGVSNFTVEEYKFNTSELATIGGGGGVGGSPTTHRKAFDVTLEAGDRAGAFRNSYFLKVKIRVSPGAR